MNQIRSLVQVFIRGLKCGMPDEWEQRDFREDFAPILTIPEEPNTELPLCGEIYLSGKTIYV
jgi:hypothetical protein